jgi:NADPH:quinone reductase
MHLEFDVIAQSEYGNPKQVLSIAKGHLDREPLGVDEILIEVSTRPVHPGDIHILTASPQTGAPRPIPAGQHRVPGFEGVGRVVEMGTNTRATKRFTKGQRVAFFPMEGAWGGFVIGKWTAAVPVPDEVSDQVAAQLLINVITASMLIRAGHSSLERPTKPPSYILLNAAASSVGRFLTQIALDLGLRPIRLVRSQEAAEKLQQILPGPPVYTTSDSNWTNYVRDALGGQQLAVAFDGVGGSAIDELASILRVGGTVINFGFLGSNGGPSLASLARNEVAVKCVSIMNWFKLTDDEKRSDVDLALSLARSHPELFQVAHEYEFADFQNAIQHVSRPGKSGVVLLSG